MRTSLLALRAVLAMCVAAPVMAASPTPEMMLCATNPAYSASVMRSVLESQLQRDHDPSLDSTPPDQLAEQAVEQGISECAEAMRKDATIYAALYPLASDERTIGWDAYNTACNDRVGSKGACITAEVGSVRALKRMAAADTPPGARALVQACQLVLKTDPAMADWRACVDQGLAVHAPPAKASACKLSVNWHVARTGAEAGRLVTACLRGG